MQDSAIQLFCPLCAEPMDDIAARRHGHNGQIRLYCCNDCSLQNGATDDDHPEGGHIRQGFHLSRA